MEIINVGKKKIIEIKLNGLDCIMCIDLKAIEHFQSENRIGLTKAIDKIQKYQDTNLMFSLICSMVRNKRNGKILGKKYLEQFDEFELISALSSSLSKLLNISLPEASNNSEKK